MLLSDRDIRAAIEHGTIALTPCDLAVALQPASVDLRIDTDDCIHPHTGEKVHRYADGSIVLHPGQFVLASTVERLTLGGTVAARIEGKSTWARLGLLAHISAGFIDPGWSGRLTLELCNLSNRFLAIPHEAYISQLSFHRLSSHVGKLYHGHYQFSPGVRQSVARDTTPSSEDQK